MNSCIKTMKLYYEVCLLLMLRTTLIELFKELYVSLGSHRLGTLEGNLAYVPVMDPGFGS